ncbi:MAG: hypothetical protein ACJ8EY_06700 [Sphingomicrobium sp.]
MMNNRLMIGVLMACVTLEGCSSRPREFAPALAAPAASRSQFDAEYADCQQLLVAGKLDSSGRVASGAAGAAVGAGTAVAGGAAAATAGGYAGLAAASATIVLLPFAILGGAWGMSRMKRARKERAIKTALEGCLKERGYQVASWTKADKKPVMKSTGTPVASSAR